MHVNQIFRNRYTITTVQMIAANMSFTSLILATASGDRSGSKDDVRRENENLCSEIDNLSREHKKLKQIVEQLDREYEDSKGYDPLRRYEILKGMVKRTIMHLRLNPDEPNASAGLGIGGLVQGCRDYNHQLESARRREEKYSSEYFIFSFVFCTIKS